MYRKAQKKRNTARKSLMKTNKRAENRAESVQPQAPSTAMRSPFLSEEGREQVAAKAIHTALAEKK